MRQQKRPVLLLLTLLAFLLACSLGGAPSPEGTTAALTVASTHTFTPFPTYTPAPAPRGQIAYSSDRDGTAHIVLMDLDSGLETDLTAGFGSYYRPVWSPDSRRLALRMDIGMGDGGGIAVQDVLLEDGRLTGSRPMELVRTFADSPTWSADGSRVAYVSAAGDQGWTAYTVGLSGSPPQLLPGIPEHANDLDWSPDGLRIVFKYYEDSTTQADDLYVINADGTGLRRLTDTPDIRENGPRWSPDGERIVYSAYAKNAQGVGSRDLYVMNSDGSGVTRVTAHPDDEFDPSWSPDGTQIAFVSDRFDFSDGNYEIYTINLDGTEEVRLTNNRHTDRWPTWRETPADVPVQECRSGAQFIADVTIPAGTRFTRPQAFSKIWRVTNSGTCAWPSAAYALRFQEGEQMGGPDQLPFDGTTQPGSTVDLVLPLTAPAAPGTHSGKWILYDGQGRPVPGPDGNPFSLLVSIEVLASGQDILPSPLYSFSDQNGSAQIWRMETDGVTVRPLTDEDGAIDSFDISPADGSVAFDSRGQVLIVDQTGANRRVLADLGEQARGNPIWSPDGHYVAYTLNGIHLYDLSSGQDRLLITNENAEVYGGIAHYQPLSWSPDGTRILVSIGYYEGGDLGILSVEDGSILAHAPLEIMHAWNNDSRTVFLASAGYPEMVGTGPGLWLVREGQDPAHLIEDAFTWWPHQQADGRLAFFSSQPVGWEITDYTIRMTVSTADGKMRSAVRNEPILLDTRDYFEARWTADHSAALVVLRRAAAGVREVLLIPADNTPPLYLAGTGSHFRWGP